tara:strand:+ start:9030 stop:9440 length:411 start_codon:yes stop_codon:yes gene_type:complete
MLGDDHNKLEFYFFFDVTADLFVVEVFLRGLALGATFSATGATFSTTGVTGATFSATGVTGATFSTTGVAGAAAAWLAALRALSLFLNINLLRACIIIFPFVLLTNINSFINPKSQKIKGGKIWWIIILKKTPRSV